MNEFKRQNVNVHQLIATMDEKKLNMSHRSFRYYLLPKAKGVFLLNEYDKFIQ